MLFLKHLIKVISADVDAGLFAYALDFLKNLAALLPVDYAVNSIKNPQSLGLWIFCVLKYDALTLPMDKSRGFLVQRPAALTSSHV
jgi:hypothetical protein